MKTTGDRDWKSPNQHRKYDSNAVTCSEALRASLHMVPEALSAEAYCLNVYLASWVNGATSNGRVNPSRQRIIDSLRFTEEQLEHASQQLNQVQWWHQVENEYRGIFLQEQWAGELKARVKQFSGLSMNHVKVIARYAGGSPLARALMLFILSRSKQVANNLGYQHFRQSGTTQSKAKLFHGTLFSCEQMLANNRQGWQVLADMKKLPESWVKQGNPVVAEFSIKEFQSKVRCSEQELNEAIEEVNELGFWQVNPDPFIDQQFRAVPQYRLHSVVWEFDQLTGGASISRWEAEAGWLEQEQEKNLPPLGYHFVYGLKVEGSRRYFLIGQTTQSLEARLNQHLAMGTNDGANEVILEVLRSTDQRIVIEHLATVFFRSVNEFEMRLANGLLEAGHPIKNRILNTAWNRISVKLDRRFGGREVSLSELTGILVRHQGKVILWQKPIMMKYTETSVSA